MSVISKLHNANFSVLLFSGILLVGTISKAEIIIEDPSQRLMSLPPYKTPIDFTSAFSCGSHASFFVKVGLCRLHCEFNICEESCEPLPPVESKFITEECYAEKASLYSTDGRTFNITKADYQTASHSVALALVKAIPLFFDGIEKIRIDDAYYPVRKSLIEDGQMTTFMMTAVAISLFPDKDKTDSYGVTIGLDLQQSGIRQLMCLSPNLHCDGMQDYFMKRKGLVNANP